MFSTARKPLDHISNAGRGVNENFQGNMAKRYLNPETNP
jgi:hypothetical protein